MKIEKVNENQIRCTLTREDLASRELKISELAYGTEKAKSLFRDMMHCPDHHQGRRSRRAGYPFFQICPLGHGRQ